jgi:transcriptional regulator with XRE-family HTH domain
VDIVEKINHLIAERETSKREFVKKLQALEPKLKSTGEVPSEQTIYGYLSGKRELKVELIPYIAEVLGVDEGELFTQEVEYISNYNHRYSKEVREIVKLLYYLPKPALLNLKDHLLEYKKLCEKPFSQNPFVKS